MMKNLVFVFLLESCSAFLSSLPSQQFTWSSSTTTISSALDKIFGNTWADITFVEGGKVTLDDVKTFVVDELFNPAYAPINNTSVPYPPNPSDRAEDQLPPGEWVAYSRREVCFIVAKVLTGATTVGYNNGLSRYANFTAGSGCKAIDGDFGRSWASLLAVCAADAALQKGGQGPSILIGKAAAAASVDAVRAAASSAPLSGSKLRTCHYDLPSSSSSSSSWTAPSAIPSVPAAGCTPPTTNGPGKDFMSGGLAGQAVQDIAAAFVGGYVYGNTCGLGGGQDERLLVYWPEVSALVFFLSEAPGTANTGDPPQLRQPVWFLGARRLLAGIDGTCRFDSQLHLDASSPIYSDLTTVPLPSPLPPVSLSSTHSFLAFMSSNQGFLGQETFDALKLARANRHPLQRAAGNGTHSFAQQTRAWFSAVSLSQYHPAIQPALAKLVTSVGSGPWLAGLWWGDSQLGVLASVVAQAAAAASWGSRGLPLDYYVYTAFTENAGNQCLVLPKDQCTACMSACLKSPLPPSSYWLPDAIAWQGPCVTEQPVGSSCGSAGYQEVLQRLFSTSSTAGEVWAKVESALSANPCPAAGCTSTVFDLLMASLPS